MYSTETWTLTSHCIKTTGSSKKYGKSNMDIILKRQKGKSVDKTTNYARRHKKR